MAENKTLPDDTAYNHGSLDAAKAAEFLAAAIKRSRGYHEYIEAYNKLNRADIEKLRAFKQTEAQAQTLSRLSFEEEKRISNLYALLTLDINIRTFIEKERAVCDMMSRVYDIIGDIHLFMFDD